jgi:DNA-binding PadR family transcriptional regulator
MKREEAFITNLTKFYTLILLYEEPRHGYDIIEEIGKKIGRKPSAGQVYPLLKRFQKIGYVSQETKSIGRKKTYRLTSAGKKFAISLLNKFSDILDVAVRQKTKKCAHCSCEIYKNGYKDAVNGLIFCCASCAESFK